MAASRRSAVGTPTSGTTAWTPSVSTQFAIELPDGRLGHARGCRPARDARAIGRALDSQTTIGTVTYTLG